MSDQPDPMTERLGQFTPDAAGLDRDAILFAAGRRSARASRVWPVLVGLLIATQTFTLVTLWPRSPEASPEVEAPAARPSPELFVPPASEPSDVWSARSRPEVVESPPSSQSGEYVSSGPILSIRSEIRID
jgi:hypothetical protein